MLIFFGCFARKRGRMFQKQGKYLRKPPRNNNLHHLRQDLISLIYYGGIFCIFCLLKPTFNRQALRAVEQFSNMKTQPKLKFIQSDRYDKQCEFP